MDAVTFKVGDWVRCISPVGALFSGAGYTVDDVMPSLIDEGNTLLGLKGVGGVYYQWRFEPAPVLSPPHTQATQEPAAPRLPTAAQDRKGLPIATGVLDYFPRAMAAIAACSKAGSEQHNPGKPLFWDRGKSMDHADCLMRHMIERGTVDTDGQRHSAKVAWRALAMLEVELEAAEQQ